MQLAAWGRPATRVLVNYFNAFTSEFGVLCVTAGCTMRRVWPRPCGHFVNPQCASRI
jgi:hypothetical protein